MNKAELKKAFADAKFSFYEIHRQVDRGQSRRLARGAPQAARDHSLPNVDCSEDVPRPSQDREGIASVSKSQYFLKGD